MAERLIDATSPYLRQHANNPVDWYQWGDEPFRLAKKRNCPVFISIGYAACHWCHVMAHESFEDRDVGDALNSAFINIKVDREEHPTVDHFYMSACTAEGRPGGWPLTILATPDRRPFYCATYLPKTSKHGRLGLLELVRRVSELWQNDPEELIRFGDELVGVLERSSQIVNRHSPDTALLTKAFEELRSRFDEQSGGFGGAPKFPSAHQLRFLLQYGYRTGDNRAAEMVEHTLLSMRIGGIFDQIGGGLLIECGNFRISKKCCRTRRC